MLFRKAPVYNCFSLDLNIPWDIRWADIWYLHNDGDISVIWWYLHWLWLAGPGLAAWWLSMLAVCHQLSYDWVPLLLICFLSARPRLPIGPRTSRTSSNLLHWSTPPALEAGWSLPGAGLLYWRGAGCRRQRRGYLVRLDQMKASQEILCQNPTHIFQSFWFYLTSFREIYQTQPTDLQRPICPD